jgi:hypothetical protein
MLKVEDKGADLQKAPWLWGFFSWEVENSTLLQYFVKQTCCRIYEINQGLSC